MAEGESTITDIDMATMQTQLAHLLQERTIARQNAPSCNTSRTPQETPKPQPSKSSLDSVGNNPQQFCPMSMGSTSQDPNFSMFVKISNNTRSQECKLSGSPLHTNPQLMMRLHSTLSGCGLTPTLSIPPPKPSPMQSAVNPRPSGILKPRTRYTLTSASSARKCSSNGKTAQPTLPYNTTGYRKPPPASSSK